MSEQKRVRPARYDRAKVCGMQAQGPFLGCCGGFFFISKRALLDYPTLIYSCTASMSRWARPSPPPLLLLPRFGCVAPASRRPQRLPPRDGAVNGCRSPLDSAAVVSDAAFTDTTHGRTIMAWRLCSPAACRCRCRCTEAPHVPVARCKPSRRRTRLFLLLPLVFPSE
jgi:hypothetical protein